MIRRHHRKASRPAEGELIYRRPLEVTTVLVFRTDGSYPVCPRCGGTLEREYQNFCDRCGQKLGWHKFPGDVNISWASHDV